MTCGWLTFRCSIFEDCFLKFPLAERQYGGVAQLGEHLPCKQGVMGSNPIISTSDSVAPKPRAKKASVQAIEARFEAEARKAKSQTDDTNQSHREK